MTTLLLGWIASAIAIIIVSNLVPGFHVSGFVSALIAALVVGLVNGTLGWIIKLITFPFRLLTLGLLSLVINALMLMLAASLVSGFAVDGFVAAFIGSIVLSIVNWVLHMFIPSGDSK